MIIDNIGMAIIVIWSAICVGVIARGIYIIYRERYPKKIKKE